MSSENTKLDLTSKNLTKTKNVKLKWEKHGLYKKCEKRRVIKYMKKSIQPYDQENAKC